MTENGRVTGRDGWMDRSKSKVDDVKAKHYRLGGGAHLLLHHATAGLDSGVYLALYTALSHNKVYICDVIAFLSNLKVVFLKTKDL